MIVPFKEYLHEEWEEGMPDNLISQLRKVGLTEEQIEELDQKAGRPFYEVTLDCTIDTDTGEVKLIEARL